MAPHHLAALGQRQILGARLMLCDADLEHGTVHLHTGRSVQVFAVLVRKMFYYCQTRGRGRGGREGTRPKGPDQKSPRRLQGTSAVLKVPGGGVLYLAALETHLLDELLEGRAIELRQAGLQQRHAPLLHDTSA